MKTHYVPFTLTLEAPLALADTDGDPNSVGTLAYVPGSSLRGAAAAGLCRRGVDRERPDEFRRLILAGQVRFLNAYLAIGGRRSLPVPASMRREKLGDRVHDLTLPPEGERGQLERLDGAFVTADQAEQFRAGVAATDRMHHQRDRTAGRPTLHEGAIFHVESLDAGQEFRGLLVLTTADEETFPRDLETLREAIGSTLLLGKSRRGGYGGAARVTFDSPRDRESDGNRLVTTDREAGAVCRVLLTSDYVGRDPHTGQVDPAAFAGELSRRLGDRIEILDRFQTFRRVGGFNRTWGLELPQGLALAAGSVFVVKATRMIPLADLLAVEHAGLGERRPEGFGRLLFLNPLEGATVVREAETAEARPPSHSPPPLLQTLQRRLLEDVVEQRLLEEAVKLRATARDEPSRSLLAQLRLPLRRPPRDAHADLRRKLDSLRPPARAALQACRLGGPAQSLDEWLRRMTSDEDLSTLLGYDALARRFHFASVEAARTTLDHPGFAQRTRLRLVDAVLALLGRPTEPSQEKKT